MKPIMKSLIICMAFFITNNTLEANDSNRHIGMKWELGYAATKEAKPEKWIPATVPGAVQLDIAKAEKYAPYYYAEHWKDYQWMGIIITPTVLTLKNRNSRQPKSYISSRKALIISLRYISMMRNYLNRKGCSQPVSY